MDDGEGDAFEPSWNTDGFHKSLSPSQLMPSVDNQVFEVIANKQPDNRLQVSVARKERKR